MWKEVKPEELKQNMFKTISKDWMLVTAGDRTAANAMTASWGGMGIMWNKNVAFLFIRPQRYTKTFLDAKDTFSLSFYDEARRDALSYMGRVSGRDEDKIAGSGLTLTFLDGVPAFEEANMVMVCRKYFAQPMDPGCILDEEVKKTWYPQEDYHTMYIAEIEKVYVK